MAKRIRPRATLDFRVDDHEVECECVRCRLKMPFSAPSELVDGFIEGDVVIFAGAGVSTEASGLLHDTFYETIAYAIGQPVDAEVPFPDVMQEYCSSPSGRVKLIEILRDRIEYIYGHRELYEDATRFHRSLATLGTINTIVTTNWDNYFEDECGAVPFVEDRDLSLWNAARRRVLKIHGSINNLGSIVATRDDYRKCASRLKNGVLGGQLKSLLATNTIVFVGYSLRDDDFLQIYNSIRRSLDRYHKKPYFISPFLTSDEHDRLENLGICPIKTDGEFFIDKMKGVLAQRGCFQPDSMFDNVREVLTYVRELHIWMHDRYDIKKKPQILPSSWYQDGLIHALDRILRLKSSGRMSDLHFLMKVGENYERFHDLYLKDRNYADSAYCLGYSYGYRYASLAPSEQESMGPPIFYYPGIEIQNKTEFSKKLSKFPNRNKRAFRYLQKLAGKYRGDVIPHHMPQLDLGRYID